MASYPPPYPPPPGSPFGFDPKQQAKYARQQYKAQARAAIMAAKAQRDFYRDQRRAARRSSILGPLMIVAFGVMFLLIRMGRIPAVTFWGWYGRWWPLLLVAAGVVLVAEWGFDHIGVEDGAPIPQRGFGGGVVFLLILLAGSGAIIHGLHDGNDLFTHSFNLDSDTFDEFLGEKHEMTQQIDQDFPAGTSLTIDNPHGDITVVGKSDDNKVHITVNKQVWTSSDSDADSKAQRLSPNVALIGSTFSVSTPSIQGGIADLSITVPAFAMTTISANHGDVNVSDINSPVTVTANHGDIELNGIKGAVMARINHRDSSFSAHHIDGDVEVHGHADDVSATDISGHLSLEGEFYGDTHLERLRGPMTFHTTRTQFSVERLDGEINISPNSELSATDIVGPTTLKTRSRNISLDRVAGDVEVTNSDGSVEVTSALPLGNISVQNRSGEVNVTVPEHSGFVVDAETRDAEIENDLGLHTTNQNSRVDLAGQVGSGGPKITLRTTHFDIGIHQKLIAPAPPATPKPPAAPKAPKPPATPKPDEPIV